MELKKNNDHYLEERKKIIKIAQIKVDDMFRDILNKDSTSPEETNVPNYFLAKMM